MVTYQYLEYLVPFGPHANCTLELCPLEWSILRYRPSLATNAGMVAIFGLLLVSHTLQGFQFRTPGHALAIVVGCVLQIVGYSGRIMLHSNPFYFPAFILQIICITIAPLFYCAAIYILLSQLIQTTDATISRLKPHLIYRLFIPADIASLILQATGGALSASSTTPTSVNKGVAISKAGLILQVITLAIFLLLFVDYLVTYRRRHIAPLAQHVCKLAFFTLLAVACILARCVYRIVEIKDGYFGPQFRDQTMFVWLEGVTMCFAVAFMNMGHPGPAFEGDRQRLRDIDAAARRNSAPRRWFSGLRSQQPSRV